MTAGALQRLNWQRHSSPHCNFAVFRPALDGLIPPPAARRPQLTQGGLPGNEMAMPAGTKPWAVAAVVEATACSVQSV